MVDVSITPANVVPGANALMKKGTAGATITAGQVVYLDTSDGKYKLADCDNTAATAVVAGIALHGASDGQPLTIVYEDDDLTIGGTVAVGVYVLSGTAGGIAPVADLASNDYVSVLGAAKSTSKLKLKILNTGAQVA